ncbi:MAG: glycosyltransferase 87 family protein [Thermoanaerobaculia bacterium]
MTAAARLHLAWWQHLLAVGAIVAVTALRFYPAVSSHEPLGDELAQERAYLQEAAGKSPYLDGSYVYPPTLLRLGAALRHLPLVSPFLPLRCLALLGLALVLWSATGWLGWKPWQRLGLALLYATLAPGVRQGIEFGNLSFAVGGMIVLALLVWERSAVASGLLLGASLLFKPLAPAALVVLFFHRPGKTHQHQLAGAVAVVAAAVPLLADPELGAFLRHGADAFVVERTVSLHRFLSLAQAPGAATMLTLLLLAAVAAAARLWVRDRAQLLAVALAGCVTVTPVVWNHTLVLTLPLQAMAIALATARFRAANDGERRWRGWEAAGVALAVAALTFAEGATGIDDRAVALQVFATLPPALAPALLAAYVLRLSPLAASGQNRVLPRGLRHDATRV